MAKGYLKDTEYRLRDLRSYVIQLMEASEKTQTDLAEVIGITQSSFCKKLKYMEFNSRELLLIFKETKADAEKVGRLMTWVD